MHENGSKIGSFWQQNGSRNAHCKNARHGLHRRGVRNGKAGKWHISPRGEDQTNNNQCAAPRQRPGSSAIQRPVVSQFEFSPIKSTYRKFPKDHLRQPPPLE
jgi:hypothetical protein